ncbi:hypothetical protein P7C71_g6469, partial [Lecanoromycetidae sp. Uapishka_2]
MRLMMRFFIACIYFTAVTEAIGSQFKVGGHTPPPFKGPSPNIPAAHVLSLTRSSGVSKSASYLKSLRKGDAVNGVYGIAPLTTAEEGQVFLSECLFGPAYSVSNTFKQIPNENFNISYGDNQFLSGIVGTEQVTLAGITVKNQEVAIVERAAWLGDGISSGLIGLAFSSITSAYAGTDPTLDVTQIQYNPVFTNMYIEGSVFPVFSIALDRNSGGQLAIGGLPPVPYLPIFASAPFQLLTITYAGAPTPVPEYQFYTITTSGFAYFESDKTDGYSPSFPNIFGPPSDSSQVQVIIDSGTTLNYLPTAITNAVNALFSPPAVYDDSQLAYLVDCSATVPEFGVKIGSETFYIDAQDMIVENPDGTCVSGINDAGDSLSILGDVFLKNVLAIFDVGASEMRFAAR